MISEPGNGGLKMIDLCSFNKSLETTWVKKYLDTNKQLKMETPLRLYVKDTKEMIN